MILLADESIDRFLIDALRKAGHDVTSIAETCPGVPDRIVLQTANKKGAVLLTADKDFGELVYKFGHGTDGVILLRLSGLQKTEKIKRVMETFHAAEQRMRNTFTVIAAHSTRIRFIPR